MCELELCGMVKLAADRQGDQSYEQTNLILAYHSKPGVYRKPPLYRSGGRSALLCHSRSRVSDLTIEPERINRATLSPWSHGNAAARPRSRAWLGGSLMSFVLERWVAST
jgi:hypothetical protein